MAPHFITTAGTTAGTTALRPYCTSQLVSLNSEREGPEEGLCAFLRRVWQLANEVLLQWLPQPQFLVSPQHLQVFCPVMQNVFYKGRNSLQAVPAGQGEGM